MLASQLYELLILNPTKNVNKIRQQGKSFGSSGALGLTPQKLGLLPEQRLRDVNMRQFNQQFELDPAMWYGAIATGPNSIAVIKLFHMFYYAGVIYKADGLNGHVYVNYMPPAQDLVGGMLVGCENAEHGRGSNPHTKAGHGLGGAQKVSACGGKKWSELKCGPLKEYNGFICDLTDRGNSLAWLLSRNLFDPDRLNDPTGTVMPVNVGVTAPGSLKALMGERRAAMGYGDDDDE